MLGCLSNAPKDNKDWLDFNKKAHTTPCLPKVLSFMPSLQRNCLQSSEAHMNNTIISRHYQKILLRSVFKDTATGSKTSKTSKNKYK